MSRFCTLDGSVINLKTVRIAMIFVCLTCFVVLVYLGISLFKQHSDFIDAYDVNAMVIAEWQQKIASKNFQNQSIDIANRKALNNEHKSAEPDVFSAIQAGQLVADHQNMFARERQMTEDEFREQYDKSMSALDVHLGDDSKNTLYCWYSPNLDAVTPTWEFITTYDFASMLTPVVWFCRSDEGELLAYATGTYVAKQDKFIDMSRKVTSVGHSYIYVIDPDEIDPDVIQFDPSDVESQLDFSEWEAN